MLELNDKQKTAVFEIEGNCIVSASPGTGKTRTLVARALNKIEKLPKHKSLALITYTNAAADEIDSRISTEKDVFIGTIHSFCLEFILRPFSWIYKWTKPIVISYEQQEGFFEANEDIDLGSSPIDELGKIRRNLDGTLSTEIEWTHGVDVETLATRYFEYQEKIGVIDFNEILYRSYKIVIENDFVAKSLSNRFFEISIDEFQDTNRYQYEILKKINESGSCSFFMVGDEKQQIFLFAGAIENAFNTALSDFESQSVVLNKTYRSTNNIINSYTALFPNHPELINESENNDLNIKVNFFETKKANHDDYLKEVVRLLVEENGIKQSEIAVLSTSWYVAYPASKVLRQEYDLVGLGALPHKKSINCSSYQVFKSLAKFYFLQSTRNLKSIRRNIDLHILENGIEIIDKSLFYKTNNLIKEFSNIELTLGIVEGIKQCQNLFNKTFSISHSTFNEIITLVSDEEKRTWTFGDYIKTLSGIDGITNNTIHKSKGLEYEAVILNHMNENKIPYQRLLDRATWTYENLTNSKIEDGRRLFYVALSRAKKYLIILHNWKPSMFIEVIKNVNDA